MLKTLGSIESTIRLRKSGVVVDDDGRDENDGKAKYNSRGKASINKVSGNKIRDDEFAEMKNY